MKKRIFGFLLGIIALIGIVQFADMFFAHEHAFAQSRPTDNTSRKPFEQKDAVRAEAYRESQEKNLQPQVEVSITSEQSLQTGYYIQPILFIPSDLQEAPNNSQSVNETFQLLKRWYSGTLEKDSNAYLFTVNNAIVYKAPQPLSYYKCPNHEVSCDTWDGIWGNVQNELRNAGYPLWVSGTSHVIFVKGAGGWAGSSCVPNCFTNWPYPGPSSEAGISILGDWALDAISGTVNPDCFAAMGTACYMDPQRGAVGHELGHTFGLAHANGQPGSIMSEWWNYPNTSLLEVAGNDEKSILRTGDKFFLTSACTYDSALTNLVMPQTVKIGSTFSSSFTVTNSGFCRYPATRSKLAIVYDDVWGVKTASLSQDLYPTRSHTFVIQMKAPMVPAKKLPLVKRNYWQMKLDTTSFGPLMGSVISLTK